MTTSTDVPHDAQRSGDPEGPSLRELVGAVALWIICGGMALAFLVVTP